MSTQNLPRLRKPKKSAIPKLREQLKQIIKEHHGTAAARDAESALTQLSASERGSD